MKNVDWNWRLGTQVSDWYTLVGYGMSYIDINDVTSTERKCAQRMPTAYLLRLKEIQAPYCWECGLYTS